MASKVHFHPTGEERADDMIEGAESVREEPDDGSHSDDTKGKKRQKNFVKRNIEVCRSSCEAMGSSRNLLRTLSTSLHCLFFSVWLD